MSEELDDFTRSYARCALWTSIGDDGEPLDRDHTLGDLAPSAKRAFREDCDGFRKQVEAMGGTPSLPMAQDFWLTRNRHGAGFWDGDWPQPYGDQLTSLAHAFGSADLYLGDDGLIYQAGSESA